VGGELYGRLPLAAPLRVVAGEVGVQVRAPGYLATERTLQVAGNSRVHTAFTFVVQPAPEPRTNGAASSPPDALVVHPTSPRRTAGWITLGGAGALVLIGVGGVVTREWEAQIWNGNQCAPPGQSRSAVCGTNRDIGTAAQTITIGAFVGAGVAGAVSAVLLLGSPRSAAVPTTARVSCRGAGLGFACGGAF
jgi:hypothetical protein